MPLERVEVAERRRPQDRRSEPEVRGLEDSIVRPVPGTAGHGEPVDELAEGLDPEAAVEVIVERCDRLPEQDRVVAPLGVGGQQSSPNHLEVEP